MTAYKMQKVKTKPYLFQERSCSMDPQDISANMGAAFHAVAEFITAQGIKSMGSALSVYYGYDPDKMTFRAGFTVSRADAKKAVGDVKADVLPAGEVLNFLHRGPYAKLRDSYGEMMEYIENKGLSVTAPSWEVYLNDPSTVTSEADLETDVFVSVT